MDMKVRIGTWVEREERVYIENWGSGQREYVTIPGNYPVYVNFTSGYSEPFADFTKASIPARVTTSTVSSEKSGDIGEIGHSDYAYNIRKHITAGNLILDERFNFLLSDVWDDGNDYPKSWADVNKLKG